MKKRSTLHITQGAIIAALYVALTFISNSLGLASGAVQVRLSEALTILPMFTWAAVPGLSIGCLLANLLTGCALWDVIFGTAATLIGSLGTYAVRDKKPVYGAICPVLSNGLIIPLVLKFAYGIPGSYWYFTATVSAGEIVCCCVLGLMLYKVIKNTKIFG